MSKKTTSTSVAKRAPAPRQATKRSAKKTAPGPLESRAEDISGSPLASVPPERDVYALHLASGFTLLTRLVPGGAMTVNRVPAGALLEVSYWKEPGQPGQGSTPLESIVLHARVDGTPLPSATVASLDGEGRLVRVSARLELPDEAKLLEYWFELDAKGGAKLWDSNWGHNHWLELAPPSPASAPSQLASLQKN